MQERVRIVNGVSIIKASNVSGVRFLDILQLIQLGRIQAVLIDFQYHISAGTLEVLKGKREGIDVLHILDRQ